MSLAPFSEVVSEHAKMVLRVCRSMLASADADDAWSETFLAAMRAYPTLDEGANVAAWLVTIAQRKCIDAIRGHTRAAIPLDQGLDTIATDPVSGPVGDVDEDLRAALASLSERQRTAVIAHHVAGLPYVEVAALLDSTPAAARRSSADGIAKLRSIYRGELET